MEITCFFHSFFQEYCRLRNSCLSTKDCRRGSGVNCGLGFMKCSENDNSCWKDDCLAKTAPKSCRNEINPVGKCDDGEDYLDEEYDRRKRSALTSQENDSYRNFMARCIGPNESYHFNVSSVHLVWRKAHQCWAAWKDYNITLGRIDLECNCSAENCSQCWTSLHKNNETGDWLSSSCSLPPLKVWQELTQYSGEWLSNVTRPFSINVTSEAVCMVPKSSSSSKNVSSIDFKGNGTCDEFKFCHPAMQKNSSGSKEKFEVDFTQLHPCQLWQLAILQDPLQFRNFWFWEKFCCCNESRASAGSLASSSSLPGFG